MRKRRLLVWLIPVLLMFFIREPSPASAHTLSPGQNPWTAWNFDDDPGTVLMLLVTGALYVVGMRRISTNGRRPSAWRVASFFAGLTVLFLVLISPIDPLAKRLFSVHMVQHLFLHIVAPILLLLGEPFTPLLKGLPQSVLRIAVRPAVRSSSMRSAYRLITGPTVASILFVASPVFWLIPSIHDIAVSNSLVHYLMHFSLFSSGFLFWWTIIDPRPRRARMPYGLRVLALGIVTIPHTVMGMIVLLSSRPLYSAYSQLGPLWDIDALTDQQIGGILLLLPGEAIMVTAAAIIGLRWFKEEEKKQLAREAAGVALERTNREQS